MVSLPSFCQQSEMNVRTQAVKSSSTLLHVSTGLFTDAGQWLCLFCQHFRARTSRNYFSLEKFYHFAKIKTANRTRFLKSWWISSDQQKIWCPGITMVLELKRGEARPGFLERRAELSCRIFLLGGQTSHTKPQTVEWLCGQDLYFFTTQREYFQSAL